MSHDGGGSFSFEDVLLREGVELHYLARGEREATYRSTFETCPADGFGGPLGDIRGNRLRPRRMYPGSHRDRSKEAFRMRPEKLDLEERHWDRVFAPSSGVAIVTTCDGDGRINAAAYGSCTRVSHSPVYLAFTAYAAHDTVANLAAVPEFTVNLPRFDKALLAKLQTVGLPFARGVNELDKAGLTALAGTAVRPPRVAECPRHFECRLEWTREWDGRVMVVGRVVAASVDADCVDAGKYIVWDRAKPVHTCGAPYIDLFVPAFEPVAVAPSYEGPERQAYEENARRMRKEG